MGSGWFRSVPIVSRLLAGWMRDGYVGSVDRRGWSCPDLGNIANGSSVGQARCLTFVIALVRLGDLCRHPVTCDKEVLRRHPHERTAYANCRDERVRDTR